MPWEQYWRHLMFYRKYLISALVAGALSLVGTSSAYAQDGYRIPIPAPATNMGQYGNYSRNAYQPPETRDSTDSNAGAWLGLAVGAAALLMMMGAGGDDSGGAYNDRYEYRDVPAPSGGYGGSGSSAPPINSFYGDCHGGSFYGC